MGADVTVIQHGADCPPARLGDWLAEAGWPVRVLRGDGGDRVPDSATGLAGLVVLGGPMGAYDDASYPWLTATKALLASAVAEGVPTLGVCLGHQLLAVATGGRVERCPTGRQAGLTPVALTAAGRADPLLAGSDGAPAVHWNQDLVVDLPPQAELLARSPAGVQAIRVGLALGVQFHPEVDPTIVRGWADRNVAAGQLSRNAADRTLAALAAADADLIRTWRGFTHRFADRLLIRREDPSGAITTYPR